MPPTSSAPPASAGRATCRTWATASATTRARCPDAVRRSGALQPRRGGVDNTQSATADDGTRCGTRSCTSWRHRRPAAQDEHVVNLDDAFCDDPRIDTTPAFSFITRISATTATIRAAPTAQSAVDRIDRFLQSGSRSSWPRRLPEGRPDRHLRRVLEQREQFRRHGRLLRRKGTGWQLLFAGHLGPGGGRVCAVPISPFIVSARCDARLHHYLPRSVGISSASTTSAAKDGNTANSVSPCSTTSSCAASAPTLHAADAEHAAAPGVG